MKVKSCMAIFVGLSLYYIGKVEAEYQLILSHKDIRDGTFSSNVKTTYLENENDPTANTFTNIGNLDPADYADADGYYTFKMVYINVHPWCDHCSRVDNDDSVTLEWKQSSWLTATTATEYTPINVPEQTNTAQAPASSFEGLVTSSQPKTLFDGNDHDYWWNSVGTIIAYSDGIPAFNERIAYTVELYIYRPVDAAVCQCVAEIADLQTQIDALDAKLKSAATEMAAARTNGDGMVDDYGDDGYDGDLSSKYDLNLNMIMVAGLSLLLLANLVTMCYFCGPRGRGKKVKYAAVFDEESDVGLSEQAQLK